MVLAEIKGIQAGPGEKAFGFLEVGTTSVSTYSIPRAQPVHMFLSTCVLLFVRILECHTPIVVDLRLRTLIDVQLEDIRSGVVAH